MATLSDAYRHLMDAAASAREARDALSAAPSPIAPTLAKLRERKRIASDLEAAVERLDELTARVEQALKEGAQ